MEKKEFNWICKETRWYNSCLQAIQEARPDQATKNHLETLPISSEAAKTYVEENFQEDEQLQIYARTLEIVDQKRAEQQQREIKKDNWDAQFTQKEYEQQLKEDEKSIQEIYFADPENDGKPNPKKAIAHLSSFLINIHQIITLEEDREFYYKSRGVYKLLGDAFIEKEGERVLGSATAYHIKELVAQTKRRSFKSRPRIKPPEHLLCLKNGILNIKNFSFQEHEHKYVRVRRQNHYFFNQIPVNYDKEAKAPTWERFMQEVVSERDAAILQEFAGYCLIQNHQFHKSLMLVGSGRNGKSTFLNTLLKLLGGDNTVCISLQQLNEDKFMPAELHNKLANIYPDLSNKSLKDVSLFKAITGEDKIPAQRKYGRPFYFTNYAKQLFSCNEIPMIENVDKAIFSRFIIIEFPHSFEGKEDKNLKEKLEAELPGILNWVIAGMNRLLSNSKFSFSPQSEQVKQDYFAQSDSVFGFLKAQCGFDPKAECFKDEVYEQYQLYCYDNSLIEIFVNQFWKKIKLHGKGRIRTGRRNNGDRVCRGLVVRGIEPILIERENIK